MTSQGWKGSHEVIKYKYIRNSQIVSIIYISCKETQALIEKSY